MVSIQFQSIDDAETLALNVAEEIYKLEGKGRIYIVTNTPRRFSGPVRKQWHKLERQKRRERSSTLRKDLIRELIAKLTWMEKLVFNTQLALDKPNGDVVITLPSIVEAEPPECNAMFIFENLTTQQIKKLTSKMPSDGRVIIYENSQ